ncbi:MAG: hypothetical protein ACREBF_04440 [Candidatus Micrarchaeales archaeon]
MIEKLEKSKPRCYVCSSGLKVEELIGVANRLSKKDKFVQLFDYDQKTIGRLLPAYMNALIREKEKQMRSNSVSKEMLALVAGKMNISKAIEKCGIKGGKKFLLFISDENLLKKSKKELRISKMNSITLKFEYSEAGKVAITPLIES